MSDLGFDAAFAAGDVRLDRLHEALTAAAARDDLLDIAYRTVDSPIGPLLLAATPAGVVRVAFDVEDHDAVLDELAADVSPRVLRAPARLDVLAAELDEYFAGRRHTFDVGVDLQLAHGFRRAVLDHLRGIPFGRTASYADDRRGRRLAAGRARRRHGVRHQPGAARRALPPRRAQRRVERQLPRRRGRQALPAHARGGVSQVATLWTSRWTKSSLRRTGSTSTNG